MLISKTISLKDLVEIAIPYDPSSNSKNLFLQKLESFPFLEKEFSDKVTEDWIQKVNHLGKVFFITNNDSWKHFKPLVPHIRVGVCGPDKVPTISLDC